jgi:hypothetical protein
LIAKEWLHCTVEEARERLSYEEIDSMGWFLLQSRKAEAGDKDAFKPDPADVAAFYRAHPEQLL